MAAKKTLQPDISTRARVLQVRAGMDADKQKPFVRIDLEMLDSEPSPTTISLKCTLDDVRKLVHNCLKALDFFGDQPASVMLRVLKKDDPLPGRRKGTARKQKLASRR